MTSPADRSPAPSRTVSISTLIKAHEGAARSVAALYDKYFDNPNVRFRFVDNSGAKAEPSDVALTCREDYAKKRGELEQLLESRRAELPEPVYQVTKG